MTTEQVKTNTEKAVAKNGAKDAADADAGWREVTTDFSIFKPAEAGGRACQGYLLRLQDMPETDNGPWSAYVVELTRPCPVASFDGEVREAKAGEEVLLPKTAKLEGLSRFLHPKAIVEVRVKPLEQVKIGKGRTMWRYEIRANEKTMRPRSAVHATLHAGATGTPRALLPAGNAGADDSDIPL